MSPLGPFWATCDALVLALHDNPLPVPGGHGVRLVDAQQVLMRVCVL